MRSRPTRRGTASAEEIVAVRKSAASPLSGRDQTGDALGPRFERALTFAARKHASQVRNGTVIPYVSHLLAVASLVLEQGGDEDQAIAALLHDTVEDCGGRPVLEEIRGAFGERVAYIVDACTDSYEEPKPPWIERKRAYVDRLASEPNEVILVSLADKVHNARTIAADYRALGEAFWRRFRASKQQVLWYERALVEVFRPKGRSPLFDELEKLVDEIERMAAETDQ